MTDFILIFISACLVNNVILDGMLGVGPAAAVSKKTDMAAGMGCTMMFVLPVAGLISYPVTHYLLIPLALEQLELISFLLIISLLVLLIVNSLKKLKPAWHELFSLFLPLALSNTAVFGVAMLNVRADHGLIGSLFFGLGSGAGFALVLLVLSAISERLALANVPKPFQGAAILLITLGMISMAFMGFAGLGSHS